MPHRCCSCLVSKGIDSFKLGREDTHSSEATTGQEKQCPGLTDLGSLQQSGDTAMPPLLLPAVFMYSPIIHRLGEPAEHWVPVCEVGLLLRDVLLAVREYLDEHTHEVRRLLLQHLVIQRAQVDEIPWEKEPQSISSAHRSRGLDFLGVAFVQAHLPRRQSVWLPSKHTQTSLHCSSRLKNKMNLRKRS